MNDEIEEKNENINLELKVFKYSEDDHVIGLIDINQLNNNDYVFNINHALFIVYDEELNSHVLYEDCIVDTTMIYNINKNKVISIFAPSSDIEEEYYNLINLIIERHNNEIDYILENDEEHYNFYQCGKIQ